MKYLLYITKGLGNTVKKEMNNVLDEFRLLDETQKYIIVDTESSLSQVTKLKTVDDAHILQKKTDFQGGPSLEQILQLFLPEELERTKSEISNFRDIGDSFSITASKYKNNSVDLDEIKSNLKTKVVNQTGNNFEEDNRNSKLDIRIHIEKDRVIYSVRITEKPLYFRNYRECGRKGSLKTSIAAGLIRMIQFRSGEKLVDNFAGAGTILCEAQIKDLEVYGGDMQREAVNCARKNLSNISGEASNRLKKLDAKDSPHPDSYFDIAVSNLPWGKHIDLNSVELYSKTFEEYRRILKDSGKLVILCDDPDLARKHIEKNFPEHQVSTQQLGFLGQTPTALVARPK